MSKLFYLTIFVISSNLICMDNSLTLKGKRKAEDELATHRLEKKQQITKFEYFELLPIQIKFHEVIDRELSKIDKSDNSKNLVDVVLENYKMYVRFKRQNKECRNYLDIPDSQTGLTGYQKIISKQLGDEDFTKLNKAVTKILWSYKSCYHSEQPSMPLDVENKLIALIDFLISQKKFNAHCEGNCENIVSAAMAHDAYKLANYLIESGKLKKIAPKGWENPLVQAVSMNRKDIIELLLKKGVNINQRDPEDGGITALMAASEHGNFELATFLINAGAQINKKGYHNETALMLASYNGHVEIVKLLLEHNADINAVADDGDKAIDWAANAGHQEIVDLFNEAWANQVLQ
ncbi:ankyrin repeat domain-containing protein [Candidatus Dependentiae bacterium]|nr:ankyrin repeat domain-containing protein [Candidatus Dependentiae bacterium]